MSDKARIIRFFTDRIVFFVLDDVDVQGSSLGDNPA